MFSLTSLDLVAGVSTFSEPLLGSTVRLFEEFSPAAVALSVATVLPSLPEFTFSASARELLTWFETGLAVPSSEPPELVPLPLFELSANAPLLELPPVLGP